MLTGREVRFKRSVSETVSGFCVRFLVAAGVVASKIAFPALLLERPLLGAAVVFGLQWGDEGKGKMVDALAAGFDMVVRYAGGANAGHTVVVDDRCFVFHMLPVAALRERTRCVIAAGVAFDPDAFVEEVARLEAAGLPTGSRITVDERAHVVLPAHKSLDGARDAAAGVGTTRRGIGPCYADRASRIGLRTIDLYDEKRLETRLAASLAESSALCALYGVEAPDHDAHLVWCRKVAEALRPHLADGARMIRETLDAGGRVLFEGAQGALLDTDFGTYPHVTSSHPGVLGIPAGCGVYVRRFDRIWGVSKCYTTRVGAGPFPTEQENPAGRRLRERGGEYGATTSRPRRCGWLDLVALRHAVAVERPDALVVTKLDVLSGLSKIPVATAYRIGRTTTDEFPTRADLLGEAEPIYEDLPGWSSDLGRARRPSDLPDAARRYLAFIEESLDVPVALVSVGERREQVVECR